MNSKTFGEKFVTLDYIKKLCKLTGQCQALETKGPNYRCNTYFLNKVLQFKLYKYESGCYYFHDFRDGHQMKYTYVPGKVLA